MNIVQYFIMTGKWLSSGENIQVDQRAYCKIHGFFRSQSALEIKTDLDNVYGEKALLYHTVV